MKKYTFSQPKEYFTKKACDERYKLDEVDCEVKQEVVINLDEEEEDKTEDVRDIKNEMKFN